MNEEERYAFEIMSAISKLFDQESDQYKYDLEEINATAFFTGYMMAFSIQYNELTNSNDDLIGGINLANRLIFQYLMENGKSR